MGLLNDIRFYLIAALAVLFLIIVAMCSSAYDSSADGHANSGVSNSHDTTTSAESDTTAEVENAVAEVEAPEVEEVVVETEEAEAQVQTVASDVQETATTEASTSTAETDTEAASSTTESTLVSKFGKFELTPLVDTGDAVPDFNNNIGSLKGDLGRYGSRLEEAQKALEKLKAAAK